MAKLFLASGTLLAALSVIAGAFGSHVLKSRLSERHLEIFETAHRYQMYHALALILFALWSQSNPLKTAPGWLFLLGTLLFSGSLYLLVASGISKWGAITPLGGVSWIAAWLMWFWFLVRA